MQQPLFFCIEKMRPGEIIECVCDKGQPGCEYSFT